MILTFNENTKVLTIDVSTNLKNQYPDRQVYIDDVKVSDSLPYSQTLTTGLYDIRVVLKNNSGSYTETRCYLYDTELLCKITRYLSQLTQEERLKNNITNLYYILLEGTKENALCGCFCTELKTIYSDVNDLILLNDCNC